MKRFIILVAATLLSANLVAAHPSDTNNWLYVLGSADWGHGNEDGDLVVLNEQTLNNGTVWARLIYSRSMDKYIIHLDDPEINENTYTVMKGMLDEIESADPQFVTSVYLNSPGGLAAAGMAIGILFREHMVSTVVTQGQECSSACAFMFIGGSFREVVKNGKIGVHAPYIEGNFGVKKCTKDEEGFFKEYVYMMLGDSTGNTNTTNKPNAAAGFYNRMMNKCDAWDMTYFYKDSVIETTDVQ
jgi:membrane-bound ClpP family serine protease